MRKLFVTFIVLFVAFNSMAQEHLTFKGIPIEGSMTEFCQKLQAKGFTQVGRENNRTMFSGNFTGRNATVGVISTDDLKNVFAVVVFFDASGEWKTLTNTYNYYKDLYSRKYGSAAASIENNPSRSDSNFSLMREVHKGTVNYYSEWEVRGGFIRLSIEKSLGYCEGFVVIHYRDTINNETKIQKDLDDI